MSKQKCAIPETMADITRCIFTFLHLNESEIFQLLHNETNLNGLNLFQIYGKFRGNNSSEGFNLEEVDLKIVNFIDDKNKLYEIVDGKLKRNSKKNRIDFYISINAVNSQKKGIDKTITPNFSILDGEMIDFHIRKGSIDLVDSNGIPCNAKAHITQK